MGGTFRHPTSGENNFPRQCYLRWVRHVDGERHHLIREERIRCSLAITRPPLGINSHDAELPALPLSGNR